jgi:integrase
VARLVLTPRFVSTASVERGRDRSVYFDTHGDAPRGFALRVTKKGARSYYLLATVPATKRRTWVRIGDARALGLDAARRAAYARAGEIARDKDPNAEARASAAKARSERVAEEVERCEWTVMELLERYRTARLGRLSVVTATEYARTIKREIKPSLLGAMKARDVVRDDVRTFVSRVAKRAPHVAVHVLALLRAAYRWALDEEVIITAEGRKVAVSRVDRDPTRKVEADLLLPMQSVRSRHLSDSELPGFWRGLDQLGRTWSAFARVILLCGTRRGETYRARWKDLDLDAGVWSIPAEHRKGRVRGTLGERRALDVPLAPLVVELLRELQPISGQRDYVFRAGGFSIGMVGNEVKRASGLKDVTIHDLRRSCSSGLQRLGAPPHVISVVLGHMREQGATATDAAYMHDRRAGEHRAWLERWANHVERLLGAAPGQLLPFRSPAAAG